MNNSTFGIQKDGHSVPIASSSVMAWRYQGRGVEDIFDITSIDPRDTMANLLDKRCLMSTSKEAPGCDSSTDTF